MRIWTLVIALILLVLTGCAAPVGSASPTPTIVRLDRSALTPSASMEAADTPPTSTSTPASSPTATSTVVAVTATLEAEPAATASPTATATAATVQAEVISAGLNVRAGPGMSYAVIGTVAQGDKLAITGASANGNWLQIVTTTGEPGWISGQAAYVRVTGSLSEVPVINSSPASQPAATAGQASVTGSQAPALASGGRLIFATRSGGDLYVVNRDGTDLRKLAGGVVDPVVSPDGNLVAFTRWDGANRGALYVLDLDSGSERVVLSDIARPKSPTWSPDGQEIIISFQHGGVVNPQPECRLFDADDTVRIPENATIVKTHFSEESNELSICFIRAEDLHWSLRRVNVATGQFEDLATDQYSYNPTWAPTHAWQVIYEGNSGLVQLDLDANNRVSITTDTRDVGPVFSPDGTKLALTYKQHDHWEVYTYDLASRSRQRLTKPPILADPQYNSAAPAWSPDGSQIAFMTDRSGQWEIWVMNADGSNQHPLFSVEVQAQLGLDYQGVNERLLNWVR